MGTGNKTSWGRETEKNGGEGIEGQLRGHFSYLFIFILDQMGMGKRTGCLTSDLNNKPFEPTLLCCLNSCLPIRNKLHQTTCLPLLWRCFIVNFKSSQTLRMQGLMNERGEPCHVSLDLPPRLPACNARHSRFHRGAKSAQGEGRKGSLHTAGFKDSYSMVEIRLNVLTSLLLPHHFINLHKFDNIRLWQPNQGYNRLSLWKITAK